MAIPLDQAYLCVNCQPEMIVALVNRACPVCNSEVCLRLTTILNRPAAQADPPTKGE